jgi:hypothetical protein
MEKHANPPFRRPMKPMGASLVGTERIDAVEASRQEQTSESTRDGRSIPEHGEDVRHSQSEAMGVGTANGAVFPPGRP